jgi:post-segregation antitoxin (ccd killing protein)
VTTGTDLNYRVTSHRQRQIHQHERTIQENQWIIEELRRAGVDVHGSERGAIANLHDNFFPFGRSELTVAARNTAIDIARTLQRTSARQIPVKAT